MPVSYSMMLPGRMSTPLIFMGDAYMPEIEKSPVLPLPAKPTKTPPNGFPFFRQGAGRD
jgi:hypothetical protein